eukprot:CAMPEP_0181391842 /NCGR_PEP_ID=MMETSP1106-20121128/26265_2 /TAXON_ID=81844 /ORGANISM="Mantoniella antarctica, Strain SL-175" /LENGTH=156 /DNA_ID=CAMNT_0023512909 /DNA_START=197 /DNA_END=667 /DNA_ORIENTATION=-
MIPMFPGQLLSAQRGSAPPGSEASALGEGGDKAGASAHAHPGVAPAAAVPTPRARGAHQRPPPMPRAFGVDCTVLTLRVSRADTVLIHGSANLPVIATAAVARSTPCNTLRAHSRGVAAADAGGADTNLSHVSGAVFLAAAAARLPRAIRRRRGVC